mmetsp:Transcript_44568/g.140640  ORF Transcript_44568/g.140640 Transcript_44568/m.140640 type:complete len:272 (+) Transcript_44568:536-1351(+)
MWNMSVTLLDISSHGGAPVSIWITVQPTDQMSAFLPCPVCRITSGAMNCGVPRRLLRGFEPPPVMLSRYLEELKSASLIMPSSVTRILPPLMSQCTTPLLWRNSRPMRICLVYFLTTGSSSAPKLAMREAMLPPETYSRKMLSRPSSVSVPRYLTMLSCCSIFITSISRCRALMASVRFFLLSWKLTSEKKICFTAISSPESALIPWYTCAYAPSPIRRPSRHRSSFLPEPLKLGLLSQSLLIVTDLLGVTRGPPAASDLSAEAESQGLTS